MTAFDTAWRKEKEDALASQLQDAYDEGREHQNVQRFIHVADPIEVMMPNNPKPQSMFRDHISSTRLVNDEGEYIDAKEAFDDMRDDLKNLARPRKNPKDPKYARIFIPDPQSKMKEIGDFHLDEGKSEEWQEKNASEPMTAFDTAWSLIKMPAKGWECPECKMPLMVEDTRGTHLSCMNCGAIAMQPARRANNRGYDSMNEMLDEHRALRIESQKQAADELRDMGANVVDKPKKLTEYNPVSQFNPMERALNELGFVSIQELLQDYVRLKGATQNQDLRSMGEEGAADELDQLWMDGLLGRHKQFDDPFMGTKRGEKWE